MYIERVSATSTELLEAFQRLVPQLTSNNAAPSWEDLAALLVSESALLFVARHDTGRIIGAASLTVYRVPTGLRAIIEDVIVDAEARGQGIGEALVHAALKAARERGVPAVTLTSNPRREAANQLYQKMGFVRRDTNAYVYKFR
jgi:ribosomal protein S18 acetylase RimI-like enzyme